MSHTEFEKMVGMTAPGLWQPPQTTAQPGLEVTVDEFVFKYLDGIEFVEYPNLAKIIQNIGNNMQLIGEVEQKPEIFDVYTVNDQGKIKQLYSKAGSGVQKMVGFNLDFEPKVQLDGKNGSSIQFFEKPCWGKFCITDAKDLDKLAKYLYVNHNIQLFHSDGNLVKMQFFKYNKKEWLVFAGDLPVCNYKVL